MKTYNDLIAAVLPDIHEIFPWDLEEKMKNGPLLLDIREPREFEAMRIEGSINVPRGILEQSCEWDYKETLPELAKARDRELIMICRSGNRSVLAAHTMQQMGYQHVYSLKTGLKGWSDYELPLVASQGKTVDMDTSDAYFATHLREDQKRPK